MFDTQTKIILSNEKTIKSIWFQDISATLLMLNNTEEVILNNNRYLYIGHPFKFNQFSVILSPNYTQDAVSSSPLFYYQGGTSPGWTSIPSTAIINTTSEAGVTNSIFRKNGSIFLTETTWYSSWVTTTVASIPNLYWVRISIDSGSTYLLNMFNYLDDLENITLAGLDLIMCNPVYITALRPNRMMIGD